MHTILSSRKEQIVDKLLLQQMCNKLVLILIIRVTLIKTKQGTKTSH